MTGNMRSCFRRKGKGTDCYDETAYPADRLLHLFGIPPQDLF